MADSGSTSGASWALGVDIGGTFTDFVARGADGRVSLWKEETTHERLEDAVERGLVALAGELDLELHELLAQASLFVHGSTIAINTLLERSGPKVGLICTDGFRDALYFRDGFKWDRYNTRLQHPVDYAPRYLRIGVRERLGAKGETLLPLDEQSVLDAAAVFRSQGVESVAVALLWSHVNSAHERRVADILAAELPDVPVLLSSAILPEIGEWTRTSATVLAAYIFPKTSAYLNRLERWLLGNSLPQRPLIMQINGGCAHVEEVLRVPVGLIGSGPAAAPNAGRRLGHAIGSANVITVDMGGTSFDVSLIRNGSVFRSREILVESQPIGIPGVELHSIGAGGGSLAWIDPGGALRVGPASAGSRPGPAAYGNGGTLPTVTDANVVLGYLSTDSFLGGRKALSMELAAAALEEHVARPLGTDVVGAAAGIVRVVNEAMVDAIRVVSVQRGIDPRPFVLVAGGGAGPIHACRLAEALELDQILVPSQAGTLSAFGMTHSNAQHDYVATCHTTSASPAIDRANELLDALEARAVEDLQASNFVRDQIEIQRFVDARYIGQVHELITPVPLGRLGPEEFAEIATSFHALHDQLYTYSLRDRPVEYLHWRVTGIGKIEQPLELDFAAANPVEATAGGSRRAVFAELGGFVDTPVIRSQELVAATRVAGPAIIDSATTTVVVYPGWELRSDDSQNFVMRRVGRTTSESPKNQAAQADRPRPHHPAVHAQEVT